MKPGFDTLFRSDKGYVLRHKKDGFYQLGFFSFILAMEAIDFKILCEVVSQKFAESYDKEHPVQTRDCIIPTPFNGMRMALTRTELNDLHQVLDQACDEGKALGMIDLFNQ